MAKTNRQYWVERAQHRELISYTNGLDVTAFLTNEYKKCATSIRKDINDFYNRYANDYGLTYEQAVREMSRPEFQEWRGTVEDYIKEIRREENPVLRERLMREYDALSYNSRISRLDGLCGNIQMNVDRLYSRAVNQLTGFLGEEFKGSYYRTMYDLQTVNGFGSNFSTINSELVEKTLAYPWSGANFSDRLWKNKNALIDAIRETLTQGMIRGDSIRDMAIALAKKLDSSKDHAMALVRTEISHIHNTAEIEAYKAGGYEEYEYMASFGEKTCKICGGLDGQHFKLKDIQYGVNFPPVHTNCRCTTVCWDEADEEHKALGGQKALDYEEWYRKYVEGREQPKLESKDGAAVELPKKPVPTMPTDNIEKIAGKPIDKTAESGIIDIERAMAAKTFDKAAEYAKQELGASISSLSELPLDMVNTINSSIRKLYKDVPSLSGIISEVLVDDINEIAKSSLRWVDGSPQIRLKLSRSYFANMSVSDIEARIAELADAGVFTHKAGIFGIIQHEAVHLAEFKQTISKYGNSKSAVEQSLDRFELAEELKELALRNCGLENTNFIINQFLCLYANDSPAEFLAEGYSSTVDNKLSNEIKRLLHKKWGL